MANKVYNSLIKMAALTVTLASASCCCCNKGQKRPAPVVPYKSAPVAKIQQPKPAKYVIKPYRTGEVFGFPIQSNNPLPSDCVVPYYDGTSFPIQTRNPLPRHRNCYFYVRPIYQYYHW